MSEKKKKSMFLDIDADQRTHEESTVSKNKISEGILRNLFLYGEHHVCEYSLTDLVRKCSDEDIGHFILNSIRCLMNGVKPSESEITSKIIPLYRHAKAFVENNGKYKENILNSIISSLEIYRNYSLPTPYVFDGLNWHKLAHIAVGVKNGINCSSIEEDYELVVEKIMSRISNS